MVPTASQGRRPSTRATLAFDRSFAVTADEVATVRQCPSPFVSSQAMTGPAAGLYIHVPFCAHRCDYCDFAVTTGADLPARRRYVAALHSELERVAVSGTGRVAPPDQVVDGAWPTFSSVFVGGGTPTLLEPEELAGVLRHLRATLPVAADAEVTIEANPETVDAPGLAVLVAAGLTRLSVGAQSFATSVLATLGRLHDPAGVGAAVAAAGQAGVARIGIDLIYGAPGETAEQWRDTLRRTVDLGAGHISCYALTVEANTPFAARVRNGQLADVDEDVQADRMAIADEVLGNAGLRRYEVSNWAEPGQESVHNQTYWRGGDWLGLGAAAHGHWRGRRWWNLRPTERYVAEVEAGRSPLGGHEVLTADQRRAERLLTGLRTVEGVRRSEVGQLDASALQALVAVGLLADDGERVRATAKGLPLADGLTKRLVPPSPSRVGDRPR